MGLMAWRRASFSFSEPRSMMRVSEGPQMENQAS